MYDIKLKKSMENFKNNYNSPIAGSYKIIEDISGSSEKNKEGLTPFKESLELAEELLAKYKTAMNNISYKEIEGYEPQNNYDKSIKHYLSNVPDNIRERFQAHGILQRQGYLETFAGALNILANESIKGYCGSLSKKDSQFGSRTHGDFLVISRIDKQLSIKDDSQKAISNEIGWRADIGAFVIDTRFYPLIDELKILFPDVNIIKASELPAYLNKQN